jgi:hypothetical protein
MTGTHDDATRSGVALVQAGWDIYSKDGRKLGEVIAVDDQLMHLRLEGMTDQRGLEVGTDTIVEQDQTEMRASISVMADEVAPGEG